MSFPRRRESIRISDGSPPEFILGLDARLRRHDRSGDGDDGHVLVDWRKSIKVLKEKGSSFIRQKGSHARFRKLGNPTRNVTIKMSYKEIPYGTFRSILLQSGLKEENFFEGEKK